ncbi:MAG: hypothetical protein IT160_15920 [Bryobacterales bacterium]|nr:hypothetical protein [Bryobacterales bacterium]
MSTVTIKSSTIFVSAEGRTRVFRSIDEIPAPLRKKLVESTTGLNSATILIADRRGREEIARSLRGEPTGIKTRFVESRTGGGNGKAPVNRRVVRLNSWQLWLSAAVLAASGLVAWAVTCFRY